MASGSKNDIVNRLLNVRLEGGGDEHPPQNMLPSNQLARRLENVADEDNGRIPEAVPSSSSAIENLQPSNNTGRLHNWQATKTTVKERLSFLFNNEILSDVHFIVGRDANQQVIPAHKFVLSVGSAVFDAMFNGVLATKSEEVELPDVEPAAFLHLLKFLYSDEVRIGPESVMTTLYTAKKYAVAALEEHCVDFLKSNLGTDNAFLLLTQARLFDEPQLAALCLEMIDKNTVDALNAEGFTDIDQDTLNAVLERDTLRIREAKIFSAVLRWSEAECIRRQLPVTPGHQRAVLGRAFNAIRFPLMSVEEFAMGPAQSGLLDDREIVQLFLYFTVNPKPNVGFLDTPRCCMTGKEITVSRFPQTESRWGYSGTSDRIRFTVNQRIFVVGFGLYGSYFGPTEYEVHLQVIHLATKKVCGSNTTTFCCDGTDDTFRAMFKEPVEISPNTSYIASAKLKVRLLVDDAANEAHRYRVREVWAEGAGLVRLLVNDEVIEAHKYRVREVWAEGAGLGTDSYYGTKGLRRVTVDGNNGEKIVFQFSYAAGNNNGTSVEDGQIPAIIFHI
ncbi:BTB/POZ domain-containing protein 2 [Papilio xuthus]|uniref:BTB/POZ domain-containing protein 2 n=2 Tax=Papilio xuthus TaxID=66420 RepID=A0A194QHQ4_PAPXU|nr:BTB/POZ domain-containing protein 2 [Papilio xuthus]